MEYVAAKTRAIRRIHQEPFYQDREECGQASQGSKFIPRAERFLCEGLYLYRESLVSSEEERLQRTKQSTREKARELKKADLIERKRD